MHLIIYVAPVCIKFQCVFLARRLISRLTFSIRHDPLFATFLLQGIFAIFKSYPTLSDPGLFLSMLSIFPEIYPCEHSENSDVLMLCLNIYSYRSENSHCYHFTSLTCIPATAPVSSLVALSRNWQRELLLCVHIGVWSSQRVCRYRCYVGRVENCLWNRKRRLGDHPNLNISVKTSGRSSQT